MLRKWLVLAVTRDRVGLESLCTTMLGDYGLTTEALFANRLALRPEDVK